MSRMPLPSPKDLLDFIESARIIIHDFESLWIWIYLFMKCYQKFLNIMKNWRFCNFKNPNKNYPECK